MEAAVLAAILMVLIFRIAPDRLERAADIPMIVDPFTIGLMLVAASALVYGAMQSEAIRNVASRIKGATDTFPVEVNFTQKGDTLIAKGGGCLECFALFELKGIHVGALQQPNAALASTLYTRGVAGSIDMIVEGENDPRIFFCIKARGGLAKDEDALVAETEAKAQALHSTIETVYEGLVNVERVGSPDLINNVSFAGYDGAGPVYRVEQQEEGPIPQPHLEKFLKGTSDGRMWISIAYEPWKTRGISLDAIRLGLKRSKIKGEYRRAVKKAGVRVMDPNLAWGGSTNTWEHDEAYKQCLRTLAPGQALVRLDDHAIKFPFLVRIGLERHGSIVHRQEAKDAGEQTPDVSLGMPKLSRILEIALLRLSENVVMTRPELGLSQRQAQELVDLKMAERDRYDCLRITEKGRDIVEAISKRDGS